MQIKESLERNSKDIKQVPFPGVRSYETVFLSRHRPTCRK